MTDSIVNSALCGAPAFGVGRAQGKGILHATMVVRHDWSGGSAGHLGTFFAVRLNAALKAYYGEGDVAPDATQRNVQKAVLIVDRTGRQRGMRQVFLPKTYDYKGVFSIVCPDDTNDTALLTVARAYAGHRLPFEP